MRNAEIFDSCFDAYKRIRLAAGNARPINPERVGYGGSSRPYLGLPQASDYLADFALLGQRSLKGQAYLTLLFTWHYVSLRDGEAVRKMLVVSPQTFDAWRDQIRKRVGGAFRRGGLWPSKHYFRTSSRSAAARFLAEVARSAEV